MDGQHDICVSRGVDNSHPIHCSAGGRFGGLSTNGESRKNFSSSGVYLTAMVVALNS